ncbi:MAG: exo-alpha-sialidase [Candidatus Thiodiazotropha sp. (ex Semelilucina semeliformis)]|nr:exo-alpha-sialidase [Candidatus Thiodiazotropha sp. (ex Semelilucina semeliformis)]
MTDRLLVGTRKGLFRIERNVNGRWEIAGNWFLGDPISMLLVESNTPRIHAAMDLGHFGVKLQRTENGGESWSEMPAPAYPEKPDEVEDKDPFRGLEIPWSTQMIWSLVAGAPDELWCGVIPGGLFRSTDGGDSWQLIRTLWDDPRRKKWMGGGYDFAGIHSILVDPRNSAHVTIGVSVGGVWTTWDSGAHWELIGTGLRSEYMPPDKAGDPLTQDPHRLVQCPASPDRLWMQHHNGIFVSEDGGVHWRELSDLPISSFGFTVAVHPNDPDTAWFVPAIKDEQRIPVDAKLVVSRTRDGGRNFDLLHQGLPDAPAYDLVYRHALEVSDDGEQLVFGSTTGSLWVSEDQGDHWQAISHHLPPILCVQFEG